MTIRRRFSVRPVGRAPLRRPRIPARRLTLRPDPGLAPLDALVVRPPNASGVLAYFPGFNTALGDWEVAKCQLLAQLSGLAVVVTEIPGLSRHGDSIPEAVRRDMMRQHAGSWTELDLRYFAAALRTLDGLPVRQVLGFSTGCSLAVAALHWLAGEEKAAGFAGERSSGGPAWEESLSPRTDAATLDALTLVEPVAILPRGLAAFAVHDLADVALLPLALRATRHQGWLRRLRGRRPHDHVVRYGLADLLAVTQVLRADELPAALGRRVAKRVALVRGAHSSLCPAAGFDALHDRLETAGVPGVTLELRGLGHQLWHSFPALVTLARAALRG